MGPMTIDIAADVYERLRARQQEGEHVSHGIDRLLDESVPDWRAHVGTLPVEDSDELQAIAIESRARAGAGGVARQQRA